MAKPLEELQLENGALAMKALTENVVARYGQRMTSCYLAGCLASITHWVIQNEGPETAFKLLTEMADVAVDAQLKKGNDDASSPNRV